MICHGLHDKIISKSLEGNNSDVRIELKECMALGNEYLQTRHQKQQLGNVGMKSARIVKPNALSKYKNLKLQGLRVHRFSSKLNHPVSVIVIFIYGKEVTKV